MISKDIWVYDSESGTYTSKYITARKYPKLPERKTCEWCVHSVKGDLYLGRIMWKAGWRKYVFQPQGSIFDSACLMMIAEMLNHMMEQWRSEKLKAKSK